MRRAPAFAAFLLASLVLAVPPAAESHGSAAPEAEVFTTLRRPVVAVGELSALDIEVLAVAPESEDALVAALVGVTPTLAPGLELARSDRPVLRRTGGVVELRRRLWLRAAAPGTYRLGGLRIALPGEAPRTLPAREVRAYDAAAAARAARHVVEVRVERTVGGARFARIGSAFLVAPDALVTAFHVVGGAREVEVRLPDGRALRTRKAWRLDAARDLAVLHVDARRARRAGLRPLPLARGGARSDVVVTAGWSGGAQRVTAAARYADLALEGGRVGLSANAVRPGDSGGPLLDTEGRVVGLVTSGRSTDGDPDLLRQDVCLSARLGSVLDGWSERPQRLGRAAPEGPAVRALSAAEHLLAVRPADPGERTQALLGAARAGDALLQFLAGSVLEELGEPRRAAVAYHDASASGYFPATYALAHHLLRSGDAVGAARLFEEVGRTEAYRHLGAMGRARALVELGRYNAAEGELRRVLDHDARFAPALYLLGVVRLSQGRDAEARALAVRLAARPAWANALWLPLERPGIRPPALEPLPLVALR